MTPLPLSLPFSSSELQPPEAPRAPSQGHGARLHLDQCNQPKGLRPTVPELHEKGVSRLIDGVTVILVSLWLDSTHCVLV